MTSYILGTLKCAGRGQSRHGQQTGEYLVRPQQCDGMNITTLAIVITQLLLITALQEDESDELVISVEELVQMYNEEEEDTPARRHPKQVSSQDQVDFNSVLGMT